MDRAWEDWAFRGQRSCAGICDSGYGRSDVESGDSVAVCCDLRTLDLRFATRLLDVLLSDSGNGV